MVSVYFRDYIVVVSVYFRDYVEVVSVHGGVPGCVGGGDL